MDFSIPQKTVNLVQRAKDLINEQLMPHEHQMLNQEFKDSLPLLNKVRAEVKARGLWAPHMSTELGGLGLSLNEFAHLSEALGQSPFGHYVFNSQAPDVGNMELLAHFGSDEQKSRWLQPLVSGDIRSCFSMTEPELAGSNPVWLGTTAVKDGDDYVINGRKWFTSSAEGAAFAIVMAVTNPDAPSAHRRASQIIVPTDTPGFELVRNISVMGEPGSDYASHAEVQYTDVRVPQSNLLGPEGGGFVLAQERLGPGRIHHCMRWIGICERSFDLMVHRAATRKLGPDTLLGSKQTIQSWIADSRAEINAARLMVLQAAWTIDKDGAPAAREEISVIKFYVANVLQNVLDRAIQTHGALGMTDDLPLAYWFRHERAARIYDGADEVHKASIAKRILRRHGVPREAL